jgi:hypothetical protein
MPTDTKASATFDDTVLTLAVTVLTFEIVPSLSTRVFAVAAKCFSSTTSFAMCPDLFTLALDTAALEIAFAFKTVAVTFVSDIFTP